MEGMAVDFQFDARGAQVFGDVTKANIGRQLAIVLDNHVESAPVIRDAITGGRGQITGNFNLASAQDLANVLRHGALPAPLKMIEERTVGPPSAEIPFTAARFPSSSAARSYGCLWRYIIAAAD